MYNTIYIIPLLLIVIAFVVTLGSRKMTEWQGRILKLISGVMMISLGSVLIINPTILSTVLYTVLVLTGAIVLSLFIAFLTRIRCRKT